MTYEARLDVDLAFHSHDALATALAEAGPPPGLLQADGQRSGWPILAQLGEYAHADLHGLHLNGWIRGHLLSDFDDRLRALAQHADGTIHGIGEDDYSWHTRLAGGVVAEHREWSAPPEHPAPTRSTGHPTSGHGGTTTERLVRVGRIELHVTHGLPRIAAVPWIGAHLEELRPLGPEAGGITLTGVTTLDAEALQAAAPDAAWQAFCNPDTATPNRWTGHHPVTGTVEAHHVDGQIVVSRRGRAPRSTGTADHQERLTQLVRLLDLPPRGGITTPAMPTPTRAGDHLTQTWQEAPHPQAGHVPRDATITPTR